jgi:predicted nuclease of predicted toxin-antitoxin system
VRLLLDEMFPAAMARELRERGHDVLSVHERPGRGADDATVLSSALAERRAVVTENVRDFRPLIAELSARGESHYGVVFTTDRRWPRSDPGRLRAALEALAASEQPDSAELWL